jgi:plastocyanin
MAKRHPAMLVDDGEPHSRWPRVSTLAATAFLLLATVAFAAALHKVIQKGRAFSVSEITIARGDRIEFDNEDEFIHQIYVDSPEINYDSAEQPPGQMIYITFDRAGTFPVRCHIHPKMLLTVHVQ